MQVHFGIELLRPEWSNAVVCIGTFDGVHLGHAAVIERAVAEARAAEQPCVLITFDRHPAAVLAPSKCPKTISPLQSNLRHFARLGVSVAIVLPFNAWLSRMSAETFLESILRRDAHATHLVVGHDFALGNGREGDTDWLAKRIRTTVVAPYEIDGVRVSSTVIREAVANGDVATAAKLLGRPLAISGVVVQGDKMGRHLGFPTANIARSFDQVLPADGVYSGRFVSERGTYAAAISIGTRPTLDGIDRRLEAYLLDFDGGSLYGLDAEVELIERLRGQERFPSKEALIEQMSRDVDLVRASSL